MKTAARKKIERPSSPASPRDIRTYPPDRETFELVLLFAARLGLEVTRVEQHQAHANIFVTDGVTRGVVSVYCNGTLTCAQSVFGKDRPAGAPPDSRSCGELLQMFIDAVGRVKSKRTFKAPVPSVRGA
ncbi:MAG TPA: hypothetical protein VGD01_16475 [Candidatus Elarobacter sp.]|jgi:hypothetical protein